MMLGYADQINVEQLDELFVHQPHLPIEQTTNHMVNISNE